MSSKNLNQLIKEEILSVIDCMRKLPETYSRPYLEGYKDAIKFFLEYSEEFKKNADREVG